MNGQKDPTLPIIAIVLAIVGVLIVRPEPFNPSRPGVTEDKSPESQQSVPARLWQDPLGVIRKSQKNKESHSVTPHITISVSEKSNYESKHGTKQNGDSVKPQSSIDTFVNAHDTCTLQKQINKRVGNNRKVVILGVMVQGGPYAEEVETRLRRRYSVLSALNVSGFVPIDATHIGYIEPKLEPESKSDTNEPVLSLPPLVPYEWFKPKENTTSNNSQNAPPTEVLVLWIDDNALVPNRESAQQKPLASLGKLIGEILQEKSCNENSASTQTANAEYSSKSVTNIEVSIFGPLPLEHSRK